MENARPRTLTHYTIKQLYYFADDELVEVLSRLTKEEIARIVNHPWCNGRILNAVGKLEPA